MSSYSVSLPSTPTHICLSSRDDALVALLYDGTTQVWDLNTCLPENGRKLKVVAEPTLRWSTKSETCQPFLPKQVAYSNEGSVYVLSSDGLASKIVTMIDGGVIHEIDNPDDASFLLACESGIASMDDRGVLRDREFSNMSLIVFIFQCREKK